jgi:ankyrin repeat protein
MKGFMVRVRGALLIAVIIVAGCTGGEKARQAPVLMIRHITLEQLDREVRLNGVEVMKGEVRQLNYAYEIADGTGRITVISERCPPLVGNLVSIQGIIARDPYRASMLIMRETTREIPGEPRASRRAYILMAIGFLVVLILMLLALLACDEEERPGLCRIDTRRVPQATHGPMRKSRLTGIYLAFAAMLLIGAVLVALNGSPIPGTLLRHAIERNDEAMVRHIVNCRPDLSKRSLAGGSAPLLLACRKGSADGVVGLLMDRGAPVDGRDGLGNTPLHLAASCGRTPLVRCLLDRGAPVNARNFAGETPLMCAMDSGATATAEVLIARGAHVNAKDRRGNSPLHRAVMRSNPEVVSLLIASGAFVDAENNLGAPPLECALEKGKNPAALAIVKELLLSGTRHEGEALHWAAHYGNCEVAELLIVRGAHPEARDREGRTPLHYAAEGGSRRMMELLLAHEASTGPQERP